MTRTTTVLLLALLVGGSAIVTGADSVASTTGVKQDPELLRFVARAAAWFPDSTFKVIEDERVPTASGAYRAATIERNCSNKFLSGQITMVIDEASEDAWVGSAAALPDEAAGVPPLQLKDYLNDFLPAALAAGMRQKVRLDWSRSSEARGALIPFDLLVDSGYGEYVKRAAVTADGRWVMMGNALPYTEDPVEYRRQMLLENDLVIWDHDAAQPKVEIVEFSDLECPGCRMKWDLIKEVLQTHGAAVRHGMVGYPMPNIHPWSFRAASAAWCLAEQQADLLLPFKELFYSMQTDMEVSLVTPTAVSFVLGNGLDEGVFRSCYLRDSSLEAVHGQLSLGHRLGVLATPTYMINGWVVQMPDETWLMPLIERLMDGHDPA